DVRRVGVARQEHPHDHVEFGVVVATQVGGRVQVTPQHLGEAVEQGDAGGGGLQGGEAGEQPGPARRGPGAGGRGRRRRATGAGGWGGGGEGGGGGTPWGGGARSRKTGGWPAGSAWRPSRSSRRPSPSSSADPAHCSASARLTLGHPAPSAAPPRDRPAAPGV